MQKIMLFSDGSCSGKGTDIGAYAGVVVTASRRKLMYGTAYPTTINRCELIPIIDGLRWIKQNVPSGIQVRIFSDSEYTIKAASGLFEPTANLDLWASYKEISDGMKIELNWRERNSHFYLTLCDAIASTLRKGQIDVAKKLFDDWTNPDETWPHATLPPEHDYNIIKGITDAHSTSS